MLGFPKFKFLRLRCEVHHIQHTLALLCIFLLGAWDSRMKFMVFRALRIVLGLWPDSVVPSTASYKMPDKPTCLVASEMKPQILQFLTLTLLCSWSLFKLVIVPSIDIFYPIVPRDTLKYLNFEPSIWVPFFLFIMLFFLPLKVFLFLSFFSPFPEF